MLKKVREIGHQALTMCIRPLRPRPQAIVGNIATCGVIYMLCKQIRLYLNFLQAQLFYKFNAKKSLSYLVFYSIIIIFVFSFLVSFILTFKVL